MIVNWTDDSSGRIVECHENNVENTLLGYAIYANSAWWIGLAKEKIQVVAYKNVEDAKHALERQLGAKTIDAID